MLFHQIILKLPNIMIKDNEVEQKKSDLINKMVKII